MKRILIVDDETQLVEMLQMRLEAHGYEVIPAYEGKEALEKARKEKPDLIILDIMLPKMNGYEVCQLLKFDEKYRHIPIIMLSARGRASDIQTGKETGADTYVTKPFQPEELMARIKEYLKD